MALTVIPYRFPGLAGVRCAFQTRTGGAYRDAASASLATGVSAAATAAKRRALREALGLDGLAEVWQVHGDAMIFEPAAVPEDSLPGQEADGLATSRPGLGLVIKTADCQPILLAHAGGRHVAALHAGWRGNRVDFPGSAVARFCEHYGLHARDILAVRGPSLGPDMAEFVNFDAEWGEGFRAWFDAKQKTMDLWSLTRQQLLAAGLAPSRIFGLDMCTASMNDLFFSYRRDKATGRQANIIWIEGIS